jgi:hypothetical protein
MDKAVQSAPVGKRVHYERRRPEETTLYTLVQEQVERRVGWKCIPYGETIERQFYGKATEKKKR